MFGLVLLGLLGYYGISTIVGYLMPKHVYTYIKYTFYTHFVGNIFKWAGEHVFALI